MSISKVLALAATKIVQDFQWRYADIHEHDFLQAFFVHIMKTSARLAHEKFEWLDCAFFLSKKCNCRTALYQNGVMMAPILTRRLHHSPILIGPYVHYLQTLRYWILSFLKLLQLFKNKEACGASVQGMLSSFGAYTVDAVCAIVCCHCIIYLHWSIREITKASCVKDFTS